MKKNRQLKVMRRTKCILIIALILLLTGCGTTATEEKLFVAIENDEVGNVKAILDNNPDINLNKKIQILRYDYEEDGGFIFASVRNKSRYEILELLVEAGADVTKIKSNGQNIFDYLHQYAPYQQDEYVEKATKLFLANGAVITETQ